LTKHIQKPSSELPVLVVGQGIAGTVVAYKLLQGGYHVHVIDNSHHNASSMVAAGLFNPLVFKWITKSWNARALLREANSTYHDLELFLESQFIHPEALVRIIASAPELAQWQRRENQEDFDGLIAPCDVALMAKWDKGYGNRGVLGSGWLDLKRLLIDFRNKLKLNNRLFETSIDYNRLVLEPELSYDGITYSHLICCEGAAAISNPFFKDVVFRNTKGEVLDVEIKGLQLKQMLNHGQFIIPLGDDIYRIGTNFDWQDLNPVPTEVTKNILVAETHDFFGFEMEVKEHQAGIRPTSPDRKPFVGRSKIHPNICLLNGLGSKGALLAPWCANQLLNHLFSEAEIHPDIDLNRTIVQP
jgi:glycine oxidase